MKYSSLKPILLFLGVWLLVSLACSTSTSSAVQDAAKEAKTAATSPALGQAKTEKTTAPAAKPTAKPTASTETASPVELTGVQGFIQDGIELTAAFIVINPNETQAVSSTEYQITVKSEDGTVLKTESGYIEFILPKEQLGVVSNIYLEEGQKAAKVEVQLNTGKAEKVDVKPPLFAIEQTQFVADNISPKVTGFIKNQLPRDISDLKVTAIAYDENGKISGGGYTYLNFIQANGQAGVDVSVNVPVKPAKVELYATLSGLSFLEKTDESAPKLKLLSSEFVQKENKAETVFFVENPDKQQSIEDSEYQIALLDETGNVLESEEGYLTIVFPGQKFATTVDMILPDGKTAAKVQVQLKTGDAKKVDLPSDLFKTDQVQFVPDNLFPKVTGVIQNSLSRDVKEMRVSAVAYDADGKLVGGGYTFLDFLPANGQSAVSISVETIAEPAKVEIYPVLSGLSILDDKTANSALQLGDYVIAKGMFGSVIVFQVTNNGSAPLESSQYQVAAYDEAGKVLATGSGYISFLFPKETLAIAEDISLPDGAKPAKITVQLSDGRSVVTDLTSNPLSADSATFVPDATFPKVTGTIKNSLNKQIKNVEVVAVEYDADGKIIGGGYTYLDFAPANGSSAVEVNVSGNGQPAKVILFPIFGGKYSIEE